MERDSGEVFRLGDRGDEADQDAVATDLGLEAGGAVVVPDGLAAVGEDDADTVLRDAGLGELHMGEDIAAA